MTLTRKILAYLTILTMVVYVGCGSSNDFGPTGNNVGTNGLSFRVQVPNNTPGAQQVTFRQDENQGVAALLQLVSSPAYAQSFSTIPGATVRAFDVNGNVVGQTIVSPAGLAVFTGLPPGTYRFVVTTASPSVVFQTIASTSETAQKTIDSASTAATLIVQQATGGQFQNADFNSVETQVRSGNTAAANALVQQVETNVASNNTWVTGDGSTVTDAGTTAVVTTATNNVNVPPSPNNTTAPVTVDDFFSLANFYTIGVGGPQNNGSITFDATNGLLANDAVNGGTISAFTSTTSTGNQVSVNADGSFTYTVLNNNFTPDSFTYTVTNASGSSTATVQLIRELGPYGRIPNANPVNGPYGGGYGPYGGGYGPYGGGYGPYGGGYGPYGGGYGPYGGGYGPYSGVDTGNVTFTFANTAPQLPAGAAVARFRFMDPNNSLVTLRTQGISTTLVQTGVQTNATQVRITYLSAFGLPLGELTVPVTMVANGNTNVDVSGQTPTAITLQSIQTNGPINVTVGGTGLIQAFGQFSNGDFLPLGDQATYTSGVPGIATVNVVGLVTGQSAGSTLVTVSALGREAPNITVNVTLP